MRAQAKTGIMARLAQVIRRGALARKGGADSRHVLPEELHSLFDEELHAHSASLDRLLQQRKAAEKA